jgi:hypothetical protein
VTDWADEKARDWVESERTSFPRAQESEIASLAALLREVATFGWNESFKAHQGRDNLLTCAYCGQEFPPGTPTSNHESLTAHGLECTENPIGQRARVAEVERDALAAQVAALVQAINEEKRWATGTQEHNEARTLLYQAATDTQAAAEAHDAPVTP